jgi:hypothetical protein
MSLKNVHKNVMHKSLCLPGELRKALPAIVLDLLEDKWNRETMEALENMKDAVK